MTRFCHLKQHKLARVRAPVFAHMLMLAESEAHVRADMDRLGPRIGDIAHFLFLHLGCGGHFLPTAASPPILGVP